MRSHSTVLTFMFSAVIFTGAIACAQPAGQMSAKTGSTKAVTSIPMSTYSIVPTKGNSKKPYTGTIAGTNPFASALSGSTIPVVVVPVVVNINGTIFDPTAPNSCGSEGGVSAITHLMQSPIVVPGNLTFNGVNVGNVQYVDGFMRAEFWETIHGNPAYTNEFSFSLAPPVTIVAGTSGITYGSGCQLLGIVNQSFLDNQILSILHSLTAVSSTEVALFVVNNVVGSSVNPPVPPGNAGCCNPGYHGASGSAPQIYAEADYNTTGLLKERNTTVVAHELAELMNDPLGNNPVPAWGGVGSVPAGSCQSNLEVGDPLVGTQITIAQNGYMYNLVELAYYSWFFNSPTTASVGAGGVFSSNGTFKGPSMACPPGGSY